MPSHTTPLGRPLSIVVADDDDDMRALVVEALRGDGHWVVEARDGEELLVALHDTGPDPAWCPDVVVSDVKMPKLSGLGALAAFRRAGLPCAVVLMTVLGDPSIESVARALGAVGVLRKPFDVDDLRTAVVNAALAHRVPHADPDAP